MGQITYRIVVTEEEFYQIKTILPLMYYTRRGFIKTNYTKSEVYYIQRKDRVFGFWHNLKNTKGKKAIAYNYKECLSLLNRYHLKHYPNKSYTIIHKTIL